MCQEYHKGKFMISTDKARLDFEVIQNTLEKSYWADNVPSDVVKTAIENSLCFGIYHRHQQIGFARVVTDFSTIAYIADLFILQKYDQKDLADWLMECICAHPKLHILKRWLLASKDGLYAQFKITPLETLEQNQGIP